MKVHGSELDLDKQPHPTAQASRERKACPSSGVIHDTIKRAEGCSGLNRSTGDAKNFNANLLRRLRDMKGGLRTGVSSSGASANCFCDDPFVKDGARNSL